jgi:hypothetical protein
MQSYSFKLDTNPSVLYPDRQEAIIIPLADIQLDPLMPGRERRANVKRLQNVVQWGVDHGAYFAGVGDYVDPASPSNRAALKSARLYDSVRDMMEKESLTLLGEMEDILAPTVGRWTNFVGGHHYWPFEEGGTTDTRLAEFLGVEYGGDLQNSLLRLTPLSGHHKQPTVKLLTWHGEGSGRTAAAPLNKLENSIVPGHVADVYVIGHYHRRSSIPKPIIDIIGGERGGEPRVVARDRWLVSAGSFLRSYQQNSRAEGRWQGGYVEKAGMPPAGLGAMAIFIMPRADDAYAAVDINVSSI